MSASDIIWLLILFGASGACSMFIFRGRKYGYEALASRSSQLNAQGVKQVWLIHGNKGMSYLKIIGNQSVRDFIIPGFLAYMSGQNLVIEFPWWRTMRPYLSIPISELTSHPAKVLYNRKVYPAVRIGNQKYIVFALNPRDAAEIKQILTKAGNANNEDLLRQFLDSLHPTSLTVGELTSTEASDPNSSSDTKLSFLKIIRGTFLYVLLPCLLLTAILIAWAVITKQPVF